MIRLAVFDIDGTLIPFSTHELAPETGEAIRRLKQNGIYTAIASGRAFQSIQPELKALGFDYYICANGSYITDSEGAVLAYHPIDEQTVDALVRDMVEKDYPVALRYVDGMRSGNPNRDLFEYSRHFFSEAQLQKAMAEADRQTAADFSGKAPIAFVSHIDAEEKLWFEQKYPGLRFLFINGGILCDIIGAGVSKGSGLRDICAYLNLDAADSIAFGDDANDIDLLQAAGIGVAMGNAIPEAKAAADDLTESCESLGVVKALEKHGLLS